MTRYLTQVVSGVETILASKVLAGSTRPAMPGTCGCRCRRLWPHQLAGQLLEGRHRRADGVDGHDDEYRDRAAEPRGSWSSGLRLRDGDERSGHRYGQGLCRSAEAAMKADTQSRPVIRVAHPSADLYGSDRVLWGPACSLRPRQGGASSSPCPVRGPLGLCLKKLQLSWRSARARFSASRPFVRLASPACWGRRSDSSWAAGQLLRNLRPQAVYVNTVTVPLWIALARVVGLPVICHVHEAEASASRLLRTLLALPVRLATHVVVNSEYSAGVLWEAAPGLAKRTTVVPNAVPGPRVPAPMPEEPHQPLRLGYVGRLSPRKGVDVVISAMAALRNEGCHRCPSSGLSFRVTKWYEAELREQVRSLGLDGKVTFRGFVADVWPASRRLMSWRCPPVTTSLSATPR